MVVSRTGTGIVTRQWQRLGELFGVVLELGPDDRALHLDLACGSDVALRRELEALLAADEACRHDDRFLRTPIDAMLEAMTRAHATPQG